MLLEIFKTTTPVATTQVPQLYFITPEMAKDLLENHNNKNREMRDAYWKAYASDMLNDQWTQGQSDMIVIDNTGNVINGQHRLKAVLESGKSQHFWVLQDADPSLYDTMDNGKTRNVLDYMPKVPNKGAISATARCLHALEYGDDTLSNMLYGRYSRNVSVGRIDAVRIANEHLDRLSQYADLAKQFAKNRLDGGNINNITIAFMLIDQLNQNNQLKAFVSHLSSISTNHKVCPLVRDRIYKIKFDKTISRGSLRQHIVLNILTAYDIFCAGDKDKSEEEIKKMLNDTGDTMVKYNDLIKNYRSLHCTM